MDKLKELLKHCKKDFINVVMEIASKQNSKREFVNRWIWTKNIAYFEKILSDLKKLDIQLDGKHATLTQRGLTFDYIVYKNRLLKNYPNAIIDLDLVFNNDKYSIEKKNGKVIYNHTIAKPFEKSLDTLQGGYCIVRIAGRGEFQTTMGVEELNKHKNLSKMQYLYNDWWQELYKKTLLRKNLKFHFEDEFTDIQEMDDEAMDNVLEKPKMTKEDVEAKIKKVETKKGLLELWNSINEELQNDTKELFTNKSQEYEV